MFESRNRALLTGLTVILALGAVPTADLSAQGVVFAGADAPSVVYVEAGGHTAYLGVQLEEETDWAEGGARITSVVEDSPADSAGLRVGDIVVGFDDKTIRGPVALTRAIHEKETGDTVELRIVREGREQTLTAELVDRTERFGYPYGVAPLSKLEFVVPQIDRQLQEKIERSLDYLQVPQAFGLTSCDEDEDCALFDYSFGWRGRPRLGVQLVDTTPELREHLGSGDGAGVLVSKVLRGTPAEFAGVQVGDLIVRVGDNSIEVVSDLRKALRDHVGETFRIEVVRDRKTIDLEVTLPEPDDDEVTGPRAALRLRPVRVAPDASPGPTALHVVPAPVVAPRPVRVAPTPPVPVAPLPVRPSLERRGMRIDREARGSV